MSALVGYYEALAQEAGSKVPLNAAQAGLVNNQAAEVPRNAAAERALHAAQANATNAAAFKTGQEGRQVAPLAQSEIGLRGAQGGYYGAESKNILAQHDPANLTDDYLAAVHHRIYGNVPDVAAPTPQPSPVGASTSQPPPGTSTYRSIGDGGPEGGGTFEPGFSSGTPKIPGKGDGTVDTVPAMLAPGEAVLNKGAAEHMGRGMIAAVNKIGLARMAASSSGAPDAKSGSAKQPKGKPAGHAQGGMVSYAMGIDEVPATAATPATQATQGGLQKRPQKHAKGTANVKAGMPSGKAPLNGDGDTPKQRDAALKADPGAANDKLHVPSMLHGMQLMAAAMGMPPARQGFSKGTSKVSKGKGGKAPSAPAGGGGALGLSPDMTTAPVAGGQPSVQDIMAMLSQQPPGQA